MKRFWVIGILVLCAGFIGSQVVDTLGAPKPAAASKVIPKKDRKPAANFQLIDLYGRRVQLSSMRGKVVLLDFWATWCPPCKAEIPIFNQLYAQYQTRGLAIVGVSLDEGGVEVVRPFVKKYKMRYSVVMGDEDIAQDYGGIHGIPTTFLIDKKGKIATKLVGFHNKLVFEKVVKSLLAE